MCKNYTLFDSDQGLSFTLYKILHLTQFCYTTNGCDGCDKYEVCAGRRATVVGQCCTQLCLDLLISFTTCHSILDSVNIASVVQKEWSYHIRGEKSIGL